MKAWVCWSEGCECRSRRGTRRPRAASGMSDSRWGVRSRLNVGSWQRLSTSRQRLSGASRRGPGTRPRAVVCWRWPRPTGVRTSAASGQWVLASRPRSRTLEELNADRAPGRPARSRRSTARALAGKDLARWLLETFAIDGPRSGAARLRDRRLTAAGDWRRSGGSCGGKRIGQKNKSHADGPDVARARGRPATSAPNGPISRRDLSREGERRRAGPRHRRWRCPGGCRRQAPAAANRIELAAVLAAGAPGGARNSSNWLSNRIFSYEDTPGTTSMEEHVPRHMGAWVLINDRWYEPCGVRTRERWRRG